MDHAKPCGESREVFRNILDDQSVGVFQGKVVVRPGAQKTDGVMQSKALLLSDGAAMNNKPELEIFADDVQCGHGATCGRLDKDQLFYLTARGLPRREAEALLIEGFANEAMDAIEDEQLRGVSQRSRQRVAFWKDQPMNEITRIQTAYDIEAVRADFPILSERPYGKPLAYLDNAASAQKPRAVIDRLTHFYEHEYANVHRGLHYLANAATEGYEGARETLRRFLNAESTDEIIFTRGATEALESGRGLLRPRAYRRRRRDHSVADGAPLQHRALAFSARAQGRGDQMDRGR